MRKQLSVSLPPDLKDRLDKFPQENWSQVARSAIETHLAIKMKRLKPVIIPPAGGWKPHAFYHVECSVNLSNPIHSGIFYTGFLEGSGEPGAYARILNTDTNYGELIYLRAIGLLLSDEQFRKTPNASKLPTDFLRSNNQQKQTGKAELT